MCMSETRIREEICRLGRSLFERGSRLGECGSASRCQNGQFALRRALRAARDRRVEIMPAAGFQLFRQSPRHVRVHGRGGDEHGILGQGFRDAVVAEQNGFGLRGVDHHADDDAGCFGGLSRCRGALAAIGDEARDRIGGNIAAGDVKTCTAQRGRHAEPHRAQPDHGDAWL